jgi:hypothetical protein
MRTCPKSHVWLSLCIETQGVVTYLEHRLWIALCAVVGWCRRVLWDVTVCIGIVRINHLE